MQDWTLILAVDAEHARELQLSWPTWRAHRPEIMEHPLLVMLDTSSCGPSTLDIIGIDHPHVTFASWPPRRFGSFPNQRAKMLWSFVAAADYIQTPYYLKLDTDVIAREPSQWYSDWWFKRNYSFIAPRWGYTKPANAIEQLEAWANRIKLGEELVDPGFARHGDRVMHKRITSWMFFGQTNWTRSMAAIAAKHPPPIYSHDTFLWFCAVRTGAHFMPISARGNGWEHVPPFKLERAAQEALTCRS